MGRCIHRCLDRVANLLPRPVRAHPIGVAGMFLWAVLGASLLVPLSKPDPKHWPDLMWPVQTLPFDTTERLAVWVLAAGMVASGLMFIVAQFAIGTPLRWPAFTRYLAIWIAAVVCLYVPFGIGFRAVFAPELVSAWWPVSVALWLTLATFFLFGARRALEPGSLGYEPNGGRVTYGRRWND